MGRLDKYFRAFTDYRKTTKPDRDAEKRRAAVTKTAQDCDVLRVTGYNCTVEEDWISAIETGLDFIGKAIAEERQFIRSNGEVVPIEKVKNVSRESVEHLSRHSNLITRVPEGADVIPDSLYTVERLTDYAVYENRFLYMLLLFVRDFVSFRFEKITEFSNTYLGEYAAEKSIEAGKRKTQLKITFKEEIKDDEYLKQNNPLKDVISRLDGLLKTVNSYLRTPLMEFVAKAPLLKPPVTETNVLKMNKNFKGATALYYYLCAYEGQGFKAEKVVKNSHPLSDKVADEFAEVEELLSFLTYEHGAGAEERLAARYAEDEAKRLAEEERKRAEKFENLRKRVHAHGGDAEEYALMLEKRVRDLEKESEKLAAAELEIAALGARCEEAQTEISGLEEKIVSERAAFDSELKKREDEYGEKIAELGGKIDGLESEIKSANSNISRLEAECESAREEKLVLGAKINAIKSEAGLLTEADDFTSEESFDEIERQYIAFKTFFKEEWKKAKKKIRKDVYKK